MAEEAVHAIGVKQPTIADLESGESQGTKHVIKIAMVCHVRPVWLETGKGVMEDETADSRITLSLKRP